MSNNTTKIHGIYIGIIVVLLLVMAGGFYYLHKQAKANYAMVQGASTMRARTGMPMGGRGMGMMAVTPPPVSDQQQQQVADGTSTKTTEKTFNITAGNFYFVPNKITVNKGDKVTLVVTNAGGFHDIVIDELSVKSPVIKTANAAMVTFTASKSGSFVFYCDVPGHRQKGMWGTLMVQ